MGRIGREAPANVAAHMNGHSAALVEDLHGAGTQAHIQVLLRQGIRNAVEMPVHLHVVIDVGFCLPPLTDFVASCRQWTQDGLVQLFEKLESGTPHLLEGTLVELVETSAYGRVDLGDAEEGMISQAGQDAAFGVEDRRLHLSFVPWSIRARGQYSGAIEPCHLLVGRMDLRLIVARFDHRGAGVVRDQ